MWLVYAQDVDRAALKSIFLIEGSSENGLRKQEDL